MSAEHDKLVSKLTGVVSRSMDRTTSLQQVADLIRRHAGFRWVGLYEVDRAAVVVRNMVWSGIGPPEYPTFPVTKGLTGTQSQNDES
jgi:putative methionine-R-sulfoxide reductase with GAF domain